MLFILFAFPYLPSCGPSAAEQAEVQKRRDDSIKTAVERKYAAEAQLKDANKQLERLKDFFKSATASLEAETDRMSKIKEWQLGRTTNEREEQIKRQSILIQNIEENISKIRKKINEVDRHIEILKTQIQ